MARNRQRAKERQARRKSGSPEGLSPDQARAQPEPAASESVRPPPDDEQIREQAHLQAGAPPEELGRSDEALDDEPDLDDDEHFDPAADHPEEDLVATSGPAGHRGESQADHKDRPRLVQFLIAVRAELARVQWPDRQALTTLTGVVLGFVVLAGSYLGLLDAIFSRLIQAIL